MHKKSIRLDTTGWRRLSTGNCVRNKNLIIPTSDICPSYNLFGENKTLKLLSDFKIKRDRLISASQQKRKRTRRTVDLAGPADHRVKIKENEKRDKYLDLARELKKQQWNIKVTMVLMVSLGTNAKCLVKGPGNLEIKG